MSECADKKSTTTDAIIHFSMDGIPLPLFFFYIFKILTSTHSSFFEITFNEKPMIRFFEDIRDML